MSHSPSNAPQAQGGALPVAVITGAANGIGWATAQVMAQAGWRVAVLDLHADAAGSCASKLGAEHAGFACDVADSGSVNRAIQAVTGRFRRVDAVINNAGVPDQTVPTLEQAADGFDRVLAVHVRGSFLVSQAVLPHLLQQPRDHRGNRGAIVNVGSIASFGGIPGRNAYCAAKAGVLGLTRAMAVEWAREGIRINAVAPGYVRTTLVAGLADKGAIDSRAIAHRTPQGRMAEPTEIAEAIAFLASPQASYVTGACLSVDGGWSAFGATESALTDL